MEASFTFETSLNEWCNYLCDINFWLDGYLHTPAYRDLVQKLSSYTHVQWNVGVGATACFARAISSIARDGVIRARGPFDVVIEVDMKHEAVLGTRSLPGINAKLAIKVGVQLGLLDQEYYRRQKADEEELLYYSYDALQKPLDSLYSVARSLVSQIFQILSTKRYLAVVENLDEPIVTTMAVDDLSDRFSLCFPPPHWNESFWLISTTSKDVYNRSKPPYDCLIGPSCGEDMVILTLYSLHQAAKYILGAIGHKDEQYWHHVSVQCFHYATVLLVPYYHPSSSHHEDGGQQSSAGLATHITSDELIRHWSAQGILAAATGSSSDGNYSDICQVGNVILEAFQEYSLLPPLPFSPATSEAENATKSAAHFLACHNLITEQHTTDELCDGSEHPARLKRMQWILHVGDQGWHLSRRQWLSDDGGRGPTTLILRHCSQQSRLIAKLDYLLAKLPSLRVLDLSYSSVLSLPPSIFCLQKLQFLSLRGCYNMTSPFSFFSNTTAITTPLPENNSNTGIIGSLLHLDLSYSNVKKFHCHFFHMVPNLQELLLLKCSNLEELPPSVASLSSLEELELTGTQIKSFPGKMFEEMKKLRSVKVIENRKLLLRRLSLRGCRKLEYVDIKEVGALEELDLSATAIKELPDSIPNLPKLRRLLLIGVPSLRRFPWHKLERFPGEFCLDQCSSISRAINKHSDHPHVAQVCISDSRLFYSFNDATKNLVRAGKLLKSFYVRVTSCKATTRKMQDGEDMVMTNTLQLAPPDYDDINRLYLTSGVSMVPMDDVPPFQETEHHVEISAADRYPHGLKHLLGVTKSISMCDDTHVSSLDDLGGLDDLEECKLRWCHKMVHVSGYHHGIRNLKNAYVSHLKSLTHFSPWYNNFNSLKHLVLEDCPRLEGVMPRGCELRSLETLDILFCYNLKEIFCAHDSSSWNNYQLPCLRRIRLQELPQLKHLHVDNPILTAPAWEELHVRGCWSLRCLPRFSQQQPDKKQAAVKVSGERAWWDKLSWDQQDQDDDAPRHRDCYEPRLPPVFASHRERVVIESYLR